MSFTPPDIKNPAVWAKKSVGLLGGSFNPAHSGHRDISTYVLENLGIDAVWWMVSPQNPAKDPKETTPLKQRIKTANEIKDNDCIVVTDVETQMNTQYTIDTLRSLKKHFPNTRFVWLMGTDCLKNIHKWAGWEEIFETVPVAVLSRPKSNNGIEQYEAVKEFNHAKMPENKALELKNAETPAWIVLNNPLNPISSTEIRAKSKVNTPIA